MSSSVSEKSLHVEVMMMMEYLVIMEMVEWVSILSMEDGDHLLISF